jgi:hypothetical protein
LRLDAGFEETVGQEEPMRSSTLVRHPSQSGHCKMDGRQHVVARVPSARRPPNVSERALAGVPSVGCRKQHGQARLSVVQADATLATYLCGGRQDRAGAEDKPHILKRQFWLDGKIAFSLPPRFLKVVRQHGRLLGRWAHADP